MLDQRLQQLGVITDLTNVKPEDVMAMAQSAELAKAQAQYATVYARAVKSRLRSISKTVKTQADLYKTADEQLREIDKQKLQMLKSSLGHQGHMTTMEAKAETVKQLSQAKAASDVEVEQTKRQRLLIELGRKHHKRLQGGKQKGLRRLFS